MRKMGKDIAKGRYNSQRCSARSRKDKNGNQIEFRLTFDEWLDIWTTSGHYEEMGRKRGQYCMSRYNDIGHYEVGNVFIQLFEQNRKDAVEGFTLSSSQKAAMMSKVVGVPKSEEHKQKISIARRKAIMTPKGECSSILEAASKFNHHTKWIHNKLKKCPTEYYYL